MRGHGRDRAAVGDRARQAPPVTVTVLRKLVEQCDTSTGTGLRDRALIVVGFALAARRSELVALDHGDIRPGPDGGILVLIRASKTDKDGAGIEVALPYGAHPETCPVRTLQAWRVYLTARGITDGPLFVRIDRHGHLGTAATGRGTDADAGRLTGQAVSMIVRRLAVAAGVPDAAAYSGHSLRSGFATEAYRTGGDPLRIADHGRWNRGSSVLLGYVRDVDRCSKNPLAGVGL